MSTPTLDRLNLEEVLGISDWDPELGCDISKLIVHDFKTKQNLHTPNDCPRPAKLIVISHTRQCLTHLACTECYTALRGIIKRIAMEHNGYNIQCTCGKVFNFNDGIWSEPI